MRNGKLSIIIPVYFNQENLLPLYDDLKKKVLDVFDGECEIVFVDDGSKDDSWTVMRSLSKKDPRIKSFKLSRNFGSHAAIMCGLSYCTGDCAVIKAADLQEPSEMILQMYQSWAHGNNVVLAVRAGRADKSTFSELYYWMVQKTAFPQMPKGGFDVFLIDRKVINVLERMNESNSAITGQILWSGFKTDEISYVRQERLVGKSRWTLKKKIRLVTDTLFSFSTLPIRLVSTIGIISFFGSIIWAAIVLVSKLLGVISVSGWTTMFIFNLFSFGIIMLSIGLLGGYLWRSFDASRGRPWYIVEHADIDDCDDFP